MIKRYNVQYASYLCELDTGEFMEYADHAALIAKVRKVAETVEHSPDCDWLHDKDLGLFGKEMENEVCTCPRGRLLALLEVGL